MVLTWGEAEAHEDNSDEIEAREVAVDYVSSLVEASFDTATIFDLALREERERAEAEMIAADAPSCTLLAVAAPPRLSLIQRRTPQIAPPLPEYCSRRGERMKALVHGLPTQWYNKCGEGVTESIRLEHLWRPQPKQHKSNFVAQKRLAILGSPLEMRLPTRRRNSGDRPKSAGPRYSFATYSSEARRAERQGDPRDSSPSSPTSFRRTVSPRISSAKLCNRLKAQSRPSGRATLTEQFLKNMPSLFSPTVEEELGEDGARLGPRDSLPRARMSQMQRNGRKTAHERSKFNSTASDTAGRARSKSLADATSSSTGQQGGSAELELGIFRVRKTRGFQEAAQLKDEVDDAQKGWELCSMARELRLPLDQVRNIRCIFDQYNLSEDDTLDSKEFEKVLIKALDLDPDKPLPATILNAKWKECDTDGSGEIDFREFLQWYAVNGFQEDLLLDQDQRDLRSLARKHGFMPDEVEVIKRQFDSFDDNRNGSVSEDEFVRLLNKLVKCPTNLEMPVARVRLFWNEIDVDGTGNISFEEFLVWYKKYFHNTAPKAPTGKPGEKNAAGTGQGCPMKAFYSGIRRLG